MAGLSSIRASAAAGASLAAVLAVVDIKEGVDTTTKGVGNITLSAEQTLNGLLTSSSRVLVTDQTAPADNGIYDSAAGAWTRATDADDDAEVTNGNLVHVLNSGSTKFKFKYLLVTPDPIVVGTTGQTWEEHRDIDIDDAAGAGDLDKIWSADQLDLRTFTRTRTSIPFADDLNIAAIFSGFGDSAIDKFRSTLSEVWKMEEASGNAIGSLNGTVLTDINTVGSIAGKSGNARDFDGVNERFDGPTVDPLFDVGTGNFLFSLWVRTDVSGTQIFMEKKDLFPGPGFQLRRSGSSAEANFFDSGGLIGQVFISGFVTGTIHHLVLLRDSGTVRIFLDNVEGTTLAVPQDLDSTRALTIGANIGGGQELNGFVDELYWWKAPSWADAAERNAQVAALSNDRFYENRYDLGTVFLNNLNAAMSADDTGAADAYVVTMDPAPVSPLVKDLRINMRVGAGNTNTGGAATVDVNGTVESIKLPDGTDPVAGDIVGDEVSELQFDGADFELLNPKISNGVAPHALGGASHTADTLANLSSKITDATLIDTGDSRLSDARTPTAHTHAAADVNSGTFVDARIAESNVTQHEAAIDHDALTNFVIGEHRTINDAGSSTTDLFSASKILADIAAVLAGIDIKEGVDTTTKGAGNITLSGEQTLNGLLTSASRVLVTDQTIPADNGIYVSAAGAWSRATDADEDAEVTNGNTLSVLNSGSTKFKFKYLLVTSDPIVVGTTGQTWEEHKDIDFGTIAGTATEGNDSRVPTQDENDALVGTGTPATGDPYVNDSDSRMTNARTPTVHAASHTDGSDDIQNATAAQKGLATATQITKLDGIETAATADQTDAEIKTAYEANADTNEFSDAEQTKLAGIETAATIDQTDAEIETAYNAQVSVVPQAEAEAGTATTRRGWTAQRVKQAIVALETGGGLGYVLDWGASITGGDAGKFARADGNPTASVVTGLIPESERTVPKAGTLNRLAWNTETADGTTVMKVHKNAVVVETLTLSGVNGTIAMTTSVALGDELALEYDAGTGPGKSNFSMYIE